MSSSHLTTPRSRRTSSPALPLKLRVPLAFAEGAPWEAIFYGEFDGRRDKRVLIKIIGE